MRSSKPKTKTQHHVDRLLAASVCIIAAASIVGHLAQAMSSKSPEPVPLVSAQNHLPLSPDKLRIIEVRAGETYEEADARDRLEASRTVTRTVTGYTSRVEETDDTPCISADGSDICKLASPTYRVCASNAYPFKARLSIEGVGTCVVHDRMASKYSDRVDVYFGNDLASARAFGSKPRKVTYLP